jgi:WD40 repeat protein
LAGSTGLCAEGTSSIGDQRTEDGAESTDLYGDPLPCGAVARMGSCRSACLGQISDLLFTPDGTRIVIVERHRITVRDVGTGKFVCRIPASGDDEFGCVALTRDGKQLVTGNWKGLIQYWPLSANPRPSRTVRLEGQSDGSLLGRHCLSGGAHRAVLWFQPTGDSTGKIRILDLVSGEILFEHSLRVLCNAAISTDGKALWTLNGKFRAWDVDSKSLQTETHITDRVHLSFDYATLAPGGKTIVTIPVEPSAGAGDPLPAAVLWDATTGRVIHRLTWPAGTGYAVTKVFSPDGKTVAAARREAVVFWDVASGKPIRQILVDEGDLRQIAFSPDGRTLATAGTDRLMSVTPGRGWRVRLWEVATGRELLPKPGHRSFIQSLAVFPNGKTVASACWSGSSDKPGTIRICNRATGKQVRTMEVPEFTGAPMAASRRGDMLAVGQNRGTILLLDPSDGKPIRQLQGHFERPNCLVFSPDGKLLVSASGSVGHDDRMGPEDNSLRIWDVTTAKQLFKYENPGDHQGVVSRAFTPDGKIFASASSQQTRLWSLAERKTLRTLARGAHALDFSPDGKILAAAADTVFSGGVGQSGWIDFYDTATGRKLHEWTVANGPVHAVKFVDDGRLLAFSDEVGSIHLRDMATGKPRAQLTDRLHGHRVAVTSLALTPDGRFLVSASRDTTLLIWDLRTLQKSTDTDRADRIDIESLDVGLFEGGRAEPIVAAKPGEAVLAYGILENVQKDEESPRPPAQCDALIEAVMPRPMGLQPVMP